MKKFLTEELFRSRGREYLLVILFFLIIGAFFTWPLLLHLHSGLLGGRGDPLLNNWILSWDAKTIFTDPTGLFQANILYPSRDVLTYSEHLLALGIMASPVYHLTGNSLLAYNLLVLLGMVFSGFGCYLLVKELTGSRWGGLVSGSFFAFCPYKMSQLSHIHILFSAFLPFCLLYLFRFLDRRRRKDLFIFACFFLAQSLVGWHYFAFSLAAVALLWLWSALALSTHDKWSRLVWVIAALLVVGAVLVPLGLPYLRTHQRLPDFQRSTAEVELFSARPGDFTGVLSNNLVYGNLPLFRSREIGSERVLFPGFLVLALALLAFILKPRQVDPDDIRGSSTFRRAPLFFLLLITLSLILCLGPNPGGVYNPLYSIPLELGLLGFIRVPIRFYTLTCLGLAVLAGYGTARLSVRVSEGRGGLKAGRWAGAGIVLLLIVEMATFNLQVYPVRAQGELQEVYSWLKDSGEAKVIELPTVPLSQEKAARYSVHMDFNSVDELQHIERECTLAYQSSFHGRTLVNGYSGYRSYFYRRIFVEMQSFPSRRSVDLLGGLGVDLVVWHWEWVEPDMEERYRAALAAADGLALAADFGDQAVYRVLPVSTAAPGDIDLGLAVPEAVPEGGRFGISVLMRNSSHKPYVSAVEEPQRVLVRFLEPSGRRLREEAAELREPFFLEAGESTYLPLGLAAPRETGELRYEISIQGAAAGAVEIAGEISVEEEEELAGAMLIDGEVSLDTAESGLEIDDPDGLFPVAVEVVNTGDGYWRSVWDKDELESGSPYGLVTILAFWERQGEGRFGEQLIQLPCDLATGQRTELPALVRPPGVAGEYRLVISLLDAEMGVFGTPWSGDVTVSEPLEGSSPCIVNLR